MQKENRTKLICCATLAFITLAVYWPVRHFEFINYDDTDYVTYNPVVSKGVTAAGLKWAFTKAHASNWHPLTWISHMVDCSLYGLHPAGHHLTNLAFHTANVLLLFLLMSRLTGALWRSFLVAVLFAWHPLHVESVAWVAERKDVLSTFFLLLTLLAYCAYATSSTKNSRGRIYYGLAIACFSLALMSKPMVVTLPFVLLLIDYWPLGRIRNSPSQPKASQTPSFTKLLLEKVPFFALAAATSVVTFWAQKSGDAVVTTGALPLSARTANALVSYVLYLWKTVWPQNLAAPYPYSHAWTFGDTAAAGVLLALISFMVFRFRKTRRYLAMGWFWFLGTLVPVIGLVQVGLASMADRYTYVPLIGIFIMVVWSIPEAWFKWPSPGLVFWAVTGGVLVFLLTSMETQLQYWRNSVALFTHSSEVTTGSILTEYNLGEALARQGDTDDAILHYQKAITLQPNPVEARYNSQLQAHFNLGLIYKSQKKLPEAEAEFRACVQQQPELSRAHAALAETLRAMGRRDEAGRESQVAVQLQMKELRQMMRAGKDK